IAVFRTSPATLSPWFMAGGTGMFWIARAAATAIAVAVVIVNVPVSPVSAATEPPVVGEVVVALFDSAQLSAVANQYRLNPTPIDQMSAQRLYLLAVSDGTPAESKALQLAADPRVRYA